MRATCLGVQPVGSVLRKGAQLPSFKLLILLSLNVWFVTKVCWDNGKCSWIWGVISHAVLLPTPQHGSSVSQCPIHTQWLLWLSHLHSSPGTGMGKASIQHQRHSRLTQQVSSCPRAHDIKEQTKSTMMCQKRPQNIRKRLFILLKKNASHFQCAPHPVNYVAGPTHNAKIWENVSKKTTCSQTFKIPSIF